MNFHFLTVSLKSKNFKKLWIKTTYWFFSFIIWTFVLYPLNLKFTVTKIFSTLVAESEEELKSLLMRVKEKIKKSGLKLNIQKKKRSWHLVPSLHGKWKGEKWKQWQILFSLAPKSTVDGDCNQEIKRCFLLGRKAMTNLDSILKSKTSFCWQRYI